MAKMIFKCCLPIKCMEAVILSIYLTNSISKLIRFPISFKSICSLNGIAYYHIVLGVCYDRKYGALGLSRKDNLMDKPLTYDSLEDLIKSFQSCYQLNNHKLVKVKLGGAIPNDICSHQNIEWSKEKISLTSNTDWSSFERNYFRKLPSASTGSCFLKGNNFRVSRLIRREHTTFNNYSNPIININFIHSISPSKSPKPKNTISPSTSFHTQTTSLIIYYYSLADYPCRLSIKTGEKSTSRILNRRRQGNIILSNSNSRQVQMRRKSKNKLNRKC